MLHVLCARKSYHENFDKLKKSNLNDIETGILKWYCSKCFNRNESTASSVALKTKRNSLNPTANETFESLQTKIKEFSTTHGILKSIGKFEEATNEINKLNEHVANQSKRIHFLEDERKLCSTKNVNELLTRVD